MAKLVDALDLGSSGATRESSSLSFRTSFYYIFRGKHAMRQVSVENTSNLGRRMNVSVPSDEIEMAIKDRLQRLTKTAQIQGFRQGKAPLKVIEQRYGSAVRREVVEELLQSSLSEALMQQNLRVAGLPNVESLKADTNQPLEYSAVFEIYPEIQLKDLSDLSLEKLKVAIKDSDVDKVIGQIQKQHVKWVVVDRAAQWDDQVTMNLIWDDPEAASGKSERKNAAIVLEKEVIAKEFEVLLGKKAGETIQIKIPVQKNRDEKPVDIAGQASIIQVAQASLPDVNEDFTKQLDVDGGVVGLRAEVQKQMQLQLDRNIKEKLKAQLIEKLLERHTIEELPQGLIDQEVNRLAQELASQFHQDPQLFANNLPEEMRNNFVSAAKQRVALSIIYGAVAKNHNLKVDNNRVKERMEQAAYSYQDPAAIMQKMAQDKQFISAIRSQILEEQIIDKLLEEVKYTEKPADYADVMKLAHQDHEHDEHVHDEHCGHDH